MAAEVSSGSQWRISGDIITIEAGSDKVESFIIHSSLLQKTPTFFQAALKGDWREKEQRRIGLPDDEAEQVGAYIEWLYSEKLIPRVAAGHQYDDNDFAKLYVFG